MMLGVGFDQVDTHRMTGGIVALHIGVKYWALLVN
jgi:demethylmenaquinone methyltransferase/2-methoxy-6-polyprenyl-1,4-benzoquinol methylase